MTIEEFLKNNIEAEVQIGSCSLYYEGGNWVVVILSKRSRRFIIIDRFLAEKDGSFSEALECLRASGK